MNSAALLDLVSSQKISLVARFHNELNRSIALRRKEVEAALKSATSREETIDLLCAKEVLTGTFDPMLKATTFLFIYSHTEEFLYHLWKTRAKSISLNKNRGSIKRFKPVLQAIGFDLLTDERWLFLCDAGLVRDCLLHANGRISLVDEPESIKSVIKRRKDLLSIHSDRIRIAPEYVRQFQEIALSMFSAPSNNEEKA